MRTTSRRNRPQRSTGVRLPPFQGFLDEHRDLVYRFLVAAVGPQDAEDCFQETFLSALRAYPRLKDGSNLRGWLLTIAHRKGIDALRSRRRGPRPVSEVPEAAVDPPEGGDPALWEAVRALPPRQREAVVLRFVTDLPYRDVGRIMRSSEEAARRNVYEGLRRLREVWQ